jgi:uncharacterized protein (DUF697 family)
MGVTLKIANLWRVIKEVDLQAIRDAALTPFELWLIDDGFDQAERMRHWLSAGEQPVPAALRVVRPDDAALVSGEVLPAAAIVFTTRRGDYAPTFLPGSSSATATAASAGAITAGGAARGTSLAPAAAAAASSAASAAASAAAQAGSAFASVDTILATLRRASIPTIVVAIGEAHADDRMVSKTERRIAIATPDAATLEQIGAALVQLVPADLRLAMARQLRALRPVVFDMTIDETSKANASYALTTGFAEVVPLLTAPLNLGDMIVLTKNQLVMSYRLALAAGRDGEPRAMIGEILGVLGGGLLFRQLARQLVGLIPVVGLVPKVAIAYGGTWAIGRAIVLWATEGREVSQDLVRSLSNEGLQRGRAVAARLVEQAREKSGSVGQRWERLKENLPLIGRRRPR